MKHWKKAGADVKTKATRSHSNNPQRVINAVRCCDSFDRCNFHLAALHCHTAIIANNARNELSLTFFCHGID